MRGFLGQALSSHRFFLGVAFEVRGQHGGGAVQHAERSQGGLTKDMDDVAKTLEAEGVASFAKSFEELLSALSTKAAELKPA